MKSIDTIRLNRRNIYEVSQRTGFDLYELEIMLQQAYARDEVVIIKIVSTVEKVKHVDEEGT